MTVTGDQSSTEQTEASLRNRNRELELMIIAEVLNRLGNEELRGQMYTLIRTLGLMRTALGDCGLSNLFEIVDDDPRVNPMGGAIAVGHPLAASGIRLMTNLARDFEANPDARYGITTMCIGLGMGGTVIWERVEEEAK